MRYNVWGIEGKMWLPRHEGKMEKLRGIEGISNAGSMVSITSDAVCTSSCIEFLAGSGGDDSAT